LFDQSKVEDDDEDEEEKQPQGCDWSCFFSEEKRRQSSIEREGKWGRRGGLYTY